MSQNIPKYVSGKVAKTILGTTSSTLRRWADNHTINVIRNTPKGKRYYDINSLYRSNNSETTNVTDFNNDDDQKRTYCYCRVSTRNQRDDLSRQIEFMRQKYPNSIIIQDIGSGINWKRKGLISLIQSIKSEKVDRVIISHKDRLCRFAYELLEQIFNLYQVEIVVLDNNQTKSEDTELADDILSIIHVFSCKKMGKRRYKKENNKDEIPEN